MKRILFVTYDFPYPLTSGGKSRAYHLLKFSKNKQNEIYLYSLVRKNPSENDVQELKKIGVSEVFYKKRKDVKKGQLFLKSLITQHSVFKHLYFNSEVISELKKICIEKKVTTIQFESFYTAYYLSNKFSELSIKQIYGSENIEHLLYLDLARFSKNPILKFVYLHQAKKVKKEEISFYQNSDETLTVTQEERKIALNNGAKLVSVVPNGIDISSFKYKNSKSRKIKKLLFVGNFSYFPNIDAVTYIFEKIFFKLSNDISITIIGKGQKNVSCIPKNNKRVKSIEYINDISDAYYTSDALLFPVKIGGGTNFKVLEAAACGLPIIAFPQKIENLGFEESKNFLSCLQPEDFISTIQSLDLDSERIHAMTRASRKLVEKNYSWENIGKEQSKVWR